MLRSVVTLALLFSMIGCANVFAPYESVTQGPSATVKLTSNAGEMGVLVFVPDANCKFKFVGRTRFNLADPQPVWKMPPGRAYFRTSVQFGNTHLGLEDVSFVLEEGQEYEINFNKLGTSAGWRGMRVEYEYNYLNTSGEFPVPVETDHFSVCEREQG